MEHSASWNLRWTKGVATEHSAVLDLDLTLRDILANQRLKEQLYLQRASIRTAVIRLVFEELMPDILRQTGEEYETPGYLGVRSHADLSAKSGVLIPNRPDTLLGIDSRIQLKISMTATSPVTALQALYGARTGVATQLANHVVDNLTQAVLGVSETRASDSVTFRDGQITDHKHRGGGSTAENN